MNNDPATKQDLAAVEARLAAVETSLAAVETRLAQQISNLEARMVEAMRDMQTELLRGFNAFSESYALRMRKLEADQSNLDAAMSGRMAVLERRLAEIEHRLGMQLMPPPPQQ
jgi:hypothetical protein